MRYDLTLLENKYHDYIIKNIDNLPQKITALKKAFEYVRNKKLADKELSLKQKQFYKKKMDDYIKEWDKLNRNGNVKLQSLRNMYKLKLDVSLIKENEDRIKAKVLNLKKQLEELNKKIEEAKQEDKDNKDNKNEQKIKEYTASINNIKKFIQPIIDREKEVAGYFRMINSVYDKFKYIDPLSIDLSI